MTRDGAVRTFAQWFLRLSLAAGFLSAVADRALRSGLLLLSFAVTMALASGIKAPLERSPNR